MEQKKLLKLQGGVNGILSPLVALFLDLASIWPNVEDGGMRITKSLGVALAFSAAFSACSTRRNPFEDRLPQEQIEEVQAMALNTVFESHAPPASVFPEVERLQAICLGLGQRGSRSSSQWISQNPRDDYWDPSPFLRTRLTAPPARILPLSQCLRDGNDREMFAETGTPVVTFFVSNPTWTTPDAVGVRVSIRGLGRYEMVYSLALRKRQGDWNVWRISCRWARTQCDHFK